MDNMYGPDSSQIQVSKSKKTMQTLHKQEAKKVFATTGTNEEYNNLYKEKEKRRTEKLRELAMVGAVDFDDLLDYQSSDYEFIDQQEQDYLLKYNDNNF